MYRKRIVTPLALNGFATVISKPAVNKWHACPGSYKNCSLGATADTIRCWQFGGNHFLGRYLQYLAGKSHWKSCKRIPIGTKRVPKGYHKLKSEPKGDRNASTNKDRRKFSQKDVLGSILVPLGRFGDTCWRPLDFEGIPKSTFFLINIKWKMMSKKGGSKNNNFSLIQKWEAWNNNKEVFASYSCNWKDLGGCDNWSKMDVQMAPLGVQGLIFWNVYGFGQDWFYPKKSLG